MRRTPTRTTCCRARSACRRARCTCAWWTPCAPTCPPCGERPTANASSPKSTSKCEASAGSSWQDAGVAAKRSYAPAAGMVAPTQLCGIALPCFALRAGQVVVQTSLAGCTCLPCNPCAPAAGVAARLGLPGATGQTGGSGTLCGAVVLYKIVKCNWGQKVAMERQPGAVFQYNISPARPRPIQWACHLLLLYQKLCRSAGVCALKILS